MSNLLPQPTTSASATGNPRNKTALKPGHSLMDWIRLRGSNVDLAGTKGVVTPVTLAELKKHNKKNDAWLAIRGKVYNVTRYMDFHPGGVEELLKGVGMDATQVFDDVHAWVNYEQMLNKCYIGPLRASAGASSTSPKIVSSSSSSQLTSGSGLTANGFRLPFSLSANNFISGSSSSTTDASHGTESRDLCVAEDVPDIVPRFDWIQKTSDIMVIFYTRPFCDPGLFIEYLGAGQVEMRIFVVGNLSYLVKFTFTDSIRWPCASVRSVIETGKLEVTFSKAEPKLWASYGAMEMTKITDLEMNFYDYNVEGCWPFNRDSYKVNIKPVGNIVMHLPIGYHLSLTCTINGEYVTRSYTPIPSFFVVEKQQSGGNSNISFLIKSYENGTLSRHICQSSNTLVQGLKVSPPMGNFSALQLKSHRSIAFFAAGSGITPFLGIVEHLLSKQPRNQVESLKLFYYNKTEKDIWCRTKLDEIAGKDSRMQIKYILSDADESWDGERGRVTRDLIAALADPCAKDNVTFMGVCGPPAFNRQVLEFMKNVGFPATSQHIFQG